MADPNGGQPGSGWTWVADWQTWVWPDRERRLYVTREGQEIPMDSDTPRIITISRQTASNHDAYGASPPNQPGYQHSPAQSGQDEADDTEALAANLSGLQVAGPERVSMNKSNSVTTVTIKGPNAHAYLDKDLARRGVKNNTYVRGSNNGNKERFFPNYKRQERPARFFKVGRVIEMLWSEPAGEARDGTMVTNTNTVPSTIAEYSGHVFSKYRRFIVVRKGHNSCTALPILTYGGQGVAKKDVKKSDHGIVYVGKAPPSPKQAERARRGEDPMLPNAVQINPDSPQEKLSEMSRINYGKVYTIEHNVKARGLGKVSPESEGALLNNFRIVWHGPDGCAPQGHSRPEPSARAMDPREVEELRRLAGLGYTLEQARQHMMGQRRIAMMAFKQALTEGYSHQEAFSMVQKTIFPHAQVAGKQKVDGNVTNHYILGPLYERLHGQRADGDDDDAEDAEEEKEQESDAEADDDDEDDAEAQRRQYLQQQARRRRSSAATAPAPHHRRTRREQPP